MGIIVAIDGPAGAGKSTVARKLAQLLGFSHIDTGALYRSVALGALRHAVDWTDAEALGTLAGKLKIEFIPHAQGQVVLLDDDDVTNEIRAPAVSQGASIVSAHGPVRAALLELQRSLGRASEKGSVLEGRDIGTVVFPDAEVKVFLTASAEERARRRYEELHAKGTPVKFDEVLEDQRRRDVADTTRAVAPLRPAEGAHVYDTTGRDTQTVIADLASLVERTASA